MSNYLKLNAFQPLEFENTTISYKFINFHQPETNLASLKLSINNIESKVYLAADIAFITAPFGADSLTFRLYRTNSLIFEKTICCLNFAALGFEPKPATGVFPEKEITKKNISYIEPKYWPIFPSSEANFFFVDTPSLSRCDLENTVTYTLTVQSSYIGYVITPLNSTSSFIAAIVHTEK